MHRFGFAWLVLAVGCGAKESPPIEDVADSNLATDSVPADTRPPARDTSSDLGIDAAADTVIDSFDAAPKVPADCGPSPARLSEFSANSLAVDATNVYFTDEGGVKRVSRCGGKVTILLTAATGETPLGIAQHDDYVFAAIGAPMFGQSTLVRIPKAGGASFTIATKLADTWPVAIDDESVYWFDYGSTYKQPLLPGGPITKLSGAGAGYAGIALDATHVYWSMPTIGGVPKAGGAAVSLAPQNGWCVGADDAFVYWTTYRDSETLYKVSSAGGEAPIALATSHDQRCLALDGDWVYWADDFIGVSRVRKSGGPSQVVGTGGASMIAIDPYHLFWTSSAGVFRGPKPPP